MKTIRKLKCLLVLALMGSMSLAHAQTRVNWSGDIQGQTISTNTTVTITGNVNLKGTIDIAEGKTLTINTNGNYTIKRSGFDGFMFRAGMFDNNTPSSQKLAHLTINGGDYTLTIDGGIEFNTANDACSGLKNDVVPTTNTGAMLGCNGHLNLTNLVLQNIYNPADHGGILCWNINTNTYYDCNVKNCTIRGFYCGSLFYFIDGDAHTAKFTDVTFTGNDTRYNTSYGGCIRTNGGTRTSITIIRGRIHHNITRFGMIHYNALGTASTKCTIMGNLEIDHNESLATAGAIFNCAKMTISSANIHHNTAATEGGAIRMNAYTGGSAGYDGDGYSLIVTDSVRIYNNEAGKSGGAIYLIFNPTVDVGYDPEGNAIDANFLLQISGGEIYNNYAPIGGAIYIDDQAPKKVYFEGMGNEGWSGEYIRNVEISGGKIHDNYTWVGANTEDCDNQHGGAIAIRRHNANNLTYTQDFGNLSVNISGGEVYQNHAYCGTGTASYNGAGGALFIWNDFDLDTYTSGCNVSVGGTAQLYGNTCGSHGAGIYLDKGNFSMTGGTIGKSTAHNVATLDGGGYCVLGGTVNVSGGVINYNDAGRNGGGFYVSVPNSTDITTIKGGALVEYNKAQNGGGAYVNQGTINIQNAATTIAYDTASIAGGGIYLGTGNVTVTDATINGNISQGSHGGGFYVANGSFTANNAAITTNHAPNGNGGGVYAGGANGHVMLNAGTRVNDNNAINGGGICVDGGNLTFTNAIMTGNEATANGGGFYTTGGDVLISGDDALIDSNNAANNGGGMYIGGDINLEGGTIIQNVASMRGGGVYVAEGGVFDMTGGIIGGTTTQGNKTSSNGSYGGGLYMGGGTATLTGGDISGNTATEGYGGGIYMEGGTCELKGGANIGGESATYANSAKFGGGIYSAGGDITVNGGHIDHNNATADGGGIYSNGPEASVLITKEGSNLSFMQYNTAVNGGGIYANRGSVVFTDGNVNYNYASNYGGGMYVNDEGTLYLKGNAVLSRNHVPTGLKGGGVYLRGTVVVGEASKAETSILAEDNFAFTTDTPETYVCDNTTRNNIYLPEPIANSYTSEIHRDVITVIEDGIGANSHVGFSVPRNHVPVIYCERSSTSWAYLDRFTTGPEHDLNTRLFDDTEHYLSVHYTGWPEAFDPDHVYLYGFWPEAVRSLDDVPDNGFTVDGNTVTISNKEGLAWLISYVNGLNNSEPHNSADLVVNLEADVDMKDFGWVPIGFRGVSGVTPKPFNGTFNGNGHLIEGVNGMVYGQGENGVVDYGLFGYVTGGTIQDVFVKGMEYYTDNNGDLILGGLIGENTGGTVSNSEVQSKLVSQSAQTLIGGLVGWQTDGTVHSSIGIADMTGGRMGGLVGELAGGDLYNSFANSKFTSKDTNKYSGGLVAVNGGTVENCYARLRGDVPSGNFGILVGDNTDGEVNYCYAPAGMTNYKAAGAAPTGHGNYGDSFLPYLYRHRDTQVSLADSDNGYVPAGDGVDKQMLIALNNWVNEMSTDDMAYTKWGRPWQESETNKPLNDDYPILKMPLNDAVAAKTGDPYLYYSPIDTLLVKYTAADEAIWMYRNNGSVNGENGDSGAKLYIAEDVALINSHPLKAYVGITLDNSAGVNGANPTYYDVEDATDWHMIATPLSDAPLGINYTNENPFAFSYGHPDDMPYYRFYLKDDPKHGYFPSHRYGTEYIAVDNNATDGGNYYNEWDFYSYDESQYHWINFKRNSASHWHMDDTTQTISYANESRLAPGKGYFAATREETFLQCFGTLNEGDVYNSVTQTPGVPRHGYNLIGNPYQAYLDFSEFARVNSSGTDEEAIWLSDTIASYTILDEDELNTTDSVETALGRKPVFYKTYVNRSSSNPEVSAGRFIHPHQGFFVLLRDRNGATATFEPTMRNTTAEDVKFRDAEHPNYPLVNLFAIEESGAADVVTVELGRPDRGGAPLMQGLRTGNGKIWCHYNDEDWAIAYTQPGITEVGIRFESAKNTEYTLRWNTRNGEFGYLHLIDNMTGADVDCLTTDEYKFSASTSDYKSRFRLVFGYTGIEENDTEATETSFAFMTGDELVVTGEGVLQVFDVSGRLVASRELHGVQSTVSLPDVSNGVYVLRLTEGKQSRVQKMVISK